MEPGKLMSSIDFDINIDTNRYYNKDNKSVPRVTEILSSMMHSDALMVWSNNLGFKGVRYRTEMNRVSALGTQTHACIERYLKDKIKSNNNIPFLGYLTWESILLDKDLVVTPVKIEEQMSCEWFGGTLDALLDISGSLYLVDFKTSNHVTYKYFLQLAAYMYMLRRNNVNVQGVIVLQLNKQSPGFNEYLLNFSIPEHNAFMNHCTDAFFALVYAYYHIKHVEEEFNNIF